MPFYIRKTKWKPGQVTISDFGPFEQKEDCQVRLTNLRKHKNSTYTIIEKETNDSQNL